MCTQRCKFAHLWRRAANPCRNTRNWAEAQGPWTALLLDGRTILIRRNLAEMTKTQQKPPKPRSIEIVAFADAQLLDIAGPLQVLATANEVMALRKAPIPYAVRVVAPQPIVITSAGLALNVAPLPRPEAGIDTLVVAGGRGIQVALKDTRFVRWLKIRSKRARRIASVCTGAFALGAIGLLDGKRATTHWIDAAALAAGTPKARVETEPIFVRDGKISTSAGVTTGIDLMLAFVEEDLGHAAALAVARELVVYLRRPGGQSQFSAVLKLQSQDRSFDALHAWIASHLTEDLSVAALAMHMGMSERTFVRHYTAAVGATPARAQSGIYAAAEHRVA
jgi:transcriptional regulator GlxA family with amidase domain